jgi:hypothetical protein
MPLADASIKLVILVGFMRRSGSRLADRFMSISVVGPAMT